MEQKKRRRFESFKAFSCLKKNINPRILWNFEDDDYEEEMI